MWFCELYLKNNSENGTPAETRYTHNPELNAKLSLMYATIPLRHVKPTDAVLMTLFNI